MEISQKDREFTQWEPLTKIYSSTKYRFSRRGEDHYVGVAGGGSLTFIFPAIVLLFFNGMIFGTNSFESVNLLNYIVTNIVIILIGFGIHYLRKIFLKPLLLDFKEKRFKVGEREVDLSGGVAVQLLNAVSTISGGHKIVFEINLVKSSGERVFLFNGPDYNLILDQAKLISDSLKLNLWDGSC